MIFPTLITNPIGFLLHFNVKGCNFNDEGGYLFEGRSRSKKMVCVPI